MEPVFSSHRSATKADDSTAHANTAAECSAHNHTAADDGRQSSTAKCQITKLKLQHTTAPTVASSAQAQRQASLRQIFNTVDASGDGLIDYDEIGQLLQILGQRFTQAELRDIVRRLDTDGNGTVDFDEFVELVTGFQQQELRDVFACTLPHYPNNVLQGATLPGSICYLPTYIYII